MPITKADKVGQQSAKSKKYQRSREAFKKQQALIPLPNSDLQFLKNIFDEGRFQLSRSQQVATATISTITPPNGQTFYYLGGVIDVQHLTGTTSIQLENDGNIRERHRYVAIDDSRIDLGLKFDSLIGDGTKAYTLTTVQSGNAVVDGSIWGYFANTPSSQGGM